VHEATDGPTGRVKFDDKDVEITFVIPGRAKREPGIHNHRREYGFPDAQLRI
jgi:hypothetical protein